MATIQRHAEQLCPGQHPISDVMSEFSLDEPESSSHAVHAELGSDQAESSHGACAAAAASSKSGGLSETANASSKNTTGKSRSPIPTGSEISEPAVCESLQASVHSLPQGCAISTSANDSILYNPIDYSKFGRMLDSDEESEHAYTPDDLGLDGNPLGKTEAEDEDGRACVHCHERAEAAVAAAVAAAPLGLDRPADANESPLPGIMSGLQQAMTDSISSSGRVLPTMIAFWFVA